MQGKKLLQNGENILKFDLFWFLKKISPSFTASMYVGEKKHLKRIWKVRVPSVVVWFTYTDFYFTGQAQSS